MDNLEELKEKITTSYNILKQNDLYVRTKIQDRTESFKELGISGHKFYLKDETKQESGSFKFRGIVNQISNLPKMGANAKDIKLLTFSAGNYGKVFANMCSKMGIDGLVIMPDFAPMERSTFIESRGLRTERHSTDNIKKALERYISQEGRIFLHPFDDINLIYGHASFGLEILEDLSKVDVALVCCGGGGILAGTALALKLFGRPDCLVYGVEPETANTMKMSFITGAPYSKNDAKSIAGGLSPPYAGKITYEVCKKYVDDIFVVTEEEILSSMVKLHQWGIKAEPSGSAAMAAVLFGKVPVLVESKHPLNVLIAITGGNCSAWDFEYVQKYC